MPVLLRAYYQQASAKAGCPDEVDFNKMYESLGDAKAQDIIRQGNPDGTHCVLLLTSANACDGCPKNSHLPEEANNQELLAENQMLIGQCFELLGDWELGAISTAQLSPIQFTMLQQAYHIRRQHHLEAQARMMAFEFGKVMGQIMARIFGAKNA